SAVSAAVTASVAVRRRYPAAVGIGVQALLVVASALSISTPPAGTGPPLVAVAWFCALYALAAWASPRWFLRGLIFFVASDLLPEAVRRDKLDTTVSFTVVAAVVMVLVHR